MSKYTDDFKLSVINHYLNGSSYHQTAKTFCIDRKQVELWVRLYQVHGIDGVRTRTGKAVYLLEFKHNAVLQLLAGKSIQTLAIELNISSPSTLLRWLKAYQNHGIIGLHPPKEQFKPKRTKCHHGTDKWIKDKIKEQFFCKLNLSSSNPRKANP